MINSRSYLLLTALIAVLLMAGMGTIQAQETSVAVVTTEDVYRTHPSFLDAQQKLQERQKEMAEELETLGEEEAAEKEREMQEELQTLQQELIQKATEEANNDIDNMAGELGFDIVIDSKGIIAGEDALNAEDITEEIVEKMEEKYETTS